MKRWQLTVLLAVAAAAGAALAPGLVERAREIGTARRVGTSKALGLDVRFDRPAIPVGTTAERNLVISVVESRFAPQTGGPVDLALVLDTSCSMGMDGRIGRATMAARLAVEALRPDDTFALVTFGDEARVVVPRRRVGDKAYLYAVVDGLREDGGTNLGEGLAAGRAELGAGRPGALRKLVVVTDGAANVGETEPAAFATLAERYADDGVSLSVVGLGLDADEAVLAAMADAAGGTYRFVGEPEELPALISHQSTLAGRTIAHGATVRIEAAPGTRIRGVRGWPATVTGDAAEVRVGDIAAGQTREIVVALDATAEGAEPRPAANVTLGWEEANGARGEVVDTAQVWGTGSAEEAARVDGLVFSAVKRAEAAERFGAAADAWSAGDDAGAGAQIAEVEALLADEDVQEPGVYAAVSAAERVRRLAEQKGPAYAAREAREASRDVAR